MKKLVASLATSVVIAGASFINVSAETYEVEDGDSLWDIAKEFNTTIQDLVDINNLDTTTLQPKQELVVNDYYEVEKGDTLSAIGKEFNVSISQIKEWNNLDSDLIIVGQELEIKGAKVSNETSDEAKQATETNDEQAESNKSEETTAQNNNDSKKEAKSAESKPDQAPEGKTISVSATAYTAKCDGCSGVTSTGVDLNANPNAKVIAVDPSVIPLGSEVYVEGYGYATAADVGGAIKGNKIDVHVPTKGEATSWGVRTVNVTIVE
ncbi:LysM peptidoglycan-binding domain-containing protein [Virgibacillus sp. MSJ-26]|uniref:LysM peptidoglycan-binding and 3D domain-containing protein n=1 Tax=Virgibacillus sp. MSJ-26 TaxID=2841522 RepID=UPI001C10D422|nr:LysM peptidoglycan-binding and 3D domain-containing protein [Virgibacillus sp. MSJ-26]MBU5466013.1 LysM peptidoglycan-binding domain-containing protein [Virgibacillus sp. MSJ-26]